MPHEENRLPGYGYSRCCGRSSITMMIMIADAILALNVVLFSHKALGHI
jgi:hypothetical protein